MEDYGCGERTGAGGSARGWRVVSELRGPTVGLASTPGVRRALPRWKETSSGERYFYNHFTRSAAGLEPANTRHRWRLLSHLSALVRVLPRSATRWATPKEWSGEQTKHARRASVTLAL